MYFLNFFSNKEEMCDGLSTFLEIRRLKLTLKTTCSKKKIIETVNEALEQENNIVTVEKPNKTLETPIDPS